MAHKFTKETHNVVQRSDLNSHISQLKLVEFIILLTSLGHLLLYIYEMI